MNDDLHGIFDDITPEMFSLDSSCVDESEGTFKGRVAFDASVDERIRGVRAAFASSFGQVNPIAVLSNPTMQRVFVPEQDENLGQFLERLKREAAMMSAHWLFFAKRNMISVVWHDPEDDGERYDVASPEMAAQAAVDGSEPEEGILWYAESREGSEIAHRHGVLRIAGNKIGEATEGDGRQTLNVFSLILDAVIR